MHVGELQCIGDGRHPGLQEVGREAQDEVAFFQVVARNNRQAEQLLVRPPQWLVVERLVEEHPVRAEGGGKAGHYLCKRSRLQVGQDGHPGAGQKPRREGGERLFPGALLPLRSIVAVEHMLYAVRVVEPLQRRLAARAEPAPVHRMHRVPFGLGDASVPMRQMHAAAGRALAAGGGKERPDTGADLFGGDHLRDQLVDQLSRRVGSKRDAASSRDPQKRAPRHV